MKLHYTPFTLQTVYPTTVDVRLNAPVLQLMSDVHMQTCDTVVNCSIPLASHGNFKTFKISESGAVTVHRRIFHTATEGVVCSLYKLVTQSCFGVHISATATL